MIFDPEEADAAGLVIDGFPRTALQADYLKLLYDKMMSLHNKYANTEDEWRFPRPSFKALTSSTCFVGCYGRRELFLSTPCHAGHQTCYVMLGGSNCLLATQQPGVYPAHSLRSRPGAGGGAVCGAGGVCAAPDDARAAGLPAQPVRFEFARAQPIPCGNVSLQSPQQAACHVRGCTYLASPM